MRDREIMSRTKVDRADEPGRVVFIFTHWFARRPSILPSAVAASSTASSSRTHTVIFTSYAFRAARARASARQFFFFRASLTTHNASERVSPRRADSDLRRRRSLERSRDEWRRARTRRSPSSVGLTPLFSKQKQLSGRRRWRWRRWNLDGLFAQRYRPYHACAMPSNAMT